MKLLVINKNPEIFEEVFRHLKPLIEELEVYCAEDSILGEWYRRAVKPDYILKSLGDLARIKNEVSACAA